MSKKDLFRLIIKLFGLYWIVLISFTLLPTFFTFIFSEYEFQWKVWLVVSVFFIFFLFLFLIYKPDMIIDWLKLDKGFDDERIEFHKFNTKSVLKLGLIILGGMLILNNLAAFVSYTFSAFQSAFLHDNPLTTRGTLTNIEWAKSFINIVTGYLLLTNYPALSKFLLKITQKKEK